MNVPAASPAPAATAKAQELLGCLDANAKACQAKPPRNILVAATYTVVKQAATRLVQSHMMMNAAVGAADEHTSTLTFRAGTISRALAGWLQTHPEPHDESWLACLRSRGCSLHG